jgi:protein Mpv17
MHFKTFTNCFVRLKDTAKVIFEKHPRIANSVVGFFTFSAGDILAQKFDTPSNKELARVDYHRAFQLGLLGIVTNGWWTTSWYNFLDRAFGSSMVSMKTVLMKMIADQFTFSPFSIAVFFGFTTYISAPKQTSIKDIWESYKTTMQENFIPAYAVDCTVWPITNIIQFRYIPLVYRPTYTSLVLLLYQSYLSFISILEHDREQHPSALEMENEEEHMFPNELMLTVVASSTSVTTSTAIASCSGTTTTNSQTSSEILKNRNN